MRKKKFLFPIKVYLSDIHYYKHKPDRELLRISVPKTSRTGGTMRTRTYGVAISFAGHYKNISICWRPDVTLYHLGLEKVRKLFKTNEFPTPPKP